LHIFNDHIGEREDLLQLEEHTCFGFPPTQLNAAGYILCPTPRGNDMERSRRGLKMQYRRVRGRKDWNAYLLRYGRSVAYAFWWEQDQQIRKSCQAFSPI
jgi:hypothetical protein